MLDETLTRRLGVIYALPYTLPPVWLLEFRDEDLDRLAGVREGGEQFRRVLGEITLRIHERESA